MKIEELCSRIVDEDVVKVSKKFSRTGEVMYDLFNSQDELLKTISLTTVMMYVENVPTTLEFNLPWDHPDFISGFIGAERRENNEDNQR